MQKRAHTHTHTHAFQHNSLHEKLFRFHFQFGIFSFSVRFFWVFFLVNGKTFNWKSNFSQKSFNMLQNILQWMWCGGRGGWGSSNHPKHIHIQSIQKGYFSIFLRHNTSKVLPRKNIIQMCRSKLSLKDLFVKGRRGQGGMVLKR